MGRESGLRGVRGVEGCSRGRYIPQARTPQNSREKCRGPVAGRVSAQSHTNGRFEGPCLHAAARARRPQGPSHWQRWADGGAQALRQEGDRVCT